MIIRDISELDKLMTQEQKAKAEADFRKYYPEGTQEIMCTSEDDGVNYLTKVNVEDFE